MSQTQNQPSIAAVVVTFNRLALLKECLDALRAQTRRLDEIIVIDNGSTDGTPQWLDEQKDLHVIHQANLGGAGGFHTGIKTAYERSHDWFWCMDDDTIATADALERIIETPHFGQARTGFLASLSLWTDGTPHRMNGGSLAPPQTWYAKVLDDKCVRMRSVSFIAVLISRKAVEAVGLPLKQLFIWYDDTEFTTRISDQFEGYLVLSSRVHHKTKVNQGPLLDRITRENATKYFFGLRNQVYLARVEPISWIRRWARVISIFGRMASMILRGRAPIRSIAWFGKGLFFSPKIDYVSAPTRAAVANNAST